MNYFEYNGKRSDRLGLIVENKIIHQLSRPDVKTEKIPGRDGVVLIDNDRLEAVERSFPTVIRGKDIHSLSTELAEWLGVKGWHDLKLSWDKGFVYRATVINTLNVEEVVRQFGRLKIDFLMHPVKYYSDNPMRKLTNGASYTNRGNIEAHPLIKITGNGDSVLSINDRNTYLTDIQGGLTIDMEARSVFHGNLAAWDKIERKEDAEMPYLDVGSNRIRWTGSISVSMQGNEGVRI